MPKRGQRPGRAAGAERLFPSWDDVRLFLAIHRGGSLTAAAGPLGVSQPTCGRRLAALEAALGMRLFERTPEGLRITERGSSLVEAASGMEREAAALALRVAADDRGCEGLVRIATTELFACSFLVGALPGIRARYPELRIELVLSNAETDLLRREADVAIRFVPEGRRPRPEALVARKLGDEPFAVHGAESYLRHRPAPADSGSLSGHDVVVYAGPHPASEWSARALRGAQVVLSAPSMQVAAAAVAAGVGLGVLPMRAGRVFPLLRPVSPVVARGTGWLAVHPDLRRVPRIRAVVDGLATAFQESRRA